MLFDWHLVNSYLDIYISNFCTTLANGSSLLIQDCQNEADDVLTEDSILDKTADSGVVSSSTPPTVKKKRNSYANSPHKLHCPYCTRSFPWASSLTRHLLTHTGKPPSHLACSRIPVSLPHIPYAHAFW